MSAAVCSKSSSACDGWQLGKLLPLFPRFHTSANSISFTSGPA